MRTGSPTCDCTRPSRRRARSGPLCGLGLLAGFLLLAGPSWAQSAEQTCVDVRVGDQRSYDCINSALARVARAAHGPTDPGTLSATSPPQAVGTFDRAATAERMGNTFGRSVLSQRPPRPVYLSPLIGARTP